MLPATPFHLPEEPEPPLAFLPLGSASPGCHRSHGFQPQARISQRHTPSVASQEALARGACGAPQSLSWRTGTLSCCWWDQLVLEASHLGWWQVTSPALDTVVVSGLVPGCGSGC